MEMNTYDELAYPSHPHIRSHPNHTGTIARFFGLRAAPTNRCRVLELGCAGGGNLLPMAEAYPDSEFVGVDLSRRQIEMGMEAVESLGFSNLSLRLGDILDIGPDWGTFDYVIAHGVYSWVPERVREKILHICRENLKPNGLAYVSYNTYPGWHMRGMLREIMCFHAGRFQQPKEKVRQSRILLDFLAEANSKDNTTFGLLLKEETQMLRQKSDGYIFHDHLEEDNNPCYFFEFARAGSRHGLQYLEDAEFSTVPPISLPPNVLENLQISDDPIQMEQYLDFLRNRTFRQSLLCHSEARLVRIIDVDLLQDLYLSSPLSRAAEDGKAGTSERVFRLGNRKVITREPMLGAALEAIGRAWPGSLSFNSLAEDLTRAGLLSPGPEGRHTLSGGLMNMVIGAAINASSTPFRGAATVSEKPRVTPLARYIASREDWMPTLRHAPCPLDELGRKVVPKLDGSLSVNALIDDLRLNRATEPISIKVDGVQIQNLAQDHERLTLCVNHLLIHLARCGSLLS